MQTFSEIFFKNVVFKILNWAAKVNTFFILTSLFNLFL